MYDYNSVDLNNFDIFFSSNPRPSSVEKNLQYLISIVRYSTRYL